MPIQRLSLFAPLPARHLETFVAVVQTLTTERLNQFKTITYVYKDETSAQGRRASDFLRLREDRSTTANDPIDDAQNKSPAQVLEVIDAPEMNKRPVTSRIVHIVPCHAGDAKKLASSMGYLLSFAYYEQGYSLTIGSVSLRVYQVFQARKKAVDESMNGNAQAEEMEGVAIGDGSTWIVHADIEVSTGSPDDLKKGTDELVRLKKELQGYVELSPLLDELR
ncbi:protein of unknown function [Taphrina deformans PYCC 5710]|uniref:Mediator of RNA polymerase II transcription subunit 18 n=1 Tax=Taphrina deformans (strain PYCC 5710 / ATCC 11124 / CBS 356.35 / IMI 108563 / JCM 9778 / NBRC 8474) TaxID=1097556 RepID=R4XBU2_TAPDE|nr:protein of unknown function [Taphrina deformans PYCC 5710]|eukprot:CCG83269.1 protein of unknown function [Taphrina deformans PYCC 5710]